VTAVVPESQGTPNYLPNILALGAITVAIAGGCLGGAVAVSHPATDWGVSTTWRALLIIEMLIWFSPTLCCIAAGISGLGVKGLGGLVWFRNPAGWLTALALISIPVIGIGLAYGSITHAAGFRAIKPGAGRPPTIVLVVAIVAASFVAVRLFTFLLDLLVKGLRRRQSRKLDRHVIGPLDQAIAQAEAVEPGTQVLDESAQAVAESSRNVAANLTGLTPLRLPLVAANPPPPDWRKSLRDALADLNASLEPTGSVQELKEALVDTKATLANITGHDLQPATEATIARDAE
jgi:hypothetical protein